MPQSSDPTPKQVKKRLASLDALRGFATISMIPFHILLFGIMFSGGDLSGLGGFGQVVSGGESLVVEWAEPLGTGLIIFFFVSGMSLAVSLTRKRETQSFSRIARRVLLRYGGYVLAGVTFEVILWSLLTQGQVSILQLIPIAVGGAIWSGPIIGIGLTAIVGFPLILKLSWRRLLAAASVLALVVMALLYYILFTQGSTPMPGMGDLPQPSILNPFLTGGFGILKCLPMMLTGAAVGKLVLKGWKATKMTVLIGAVISIGYAIIPALYGSGGTHILIAMWAYPHALLFTIGNSLLLFGIFRILETRKINLTPITVIGRTTLQTYYGHWLLLFPLLMIIGAAASPLTLGLLMLIITLTVWTIIYFYSKWRWGKPSEW